MPTHEAAASGGDHNPVASPTVWAVQRRKYAAWLTALVAPFLAAGFVYALIVVDASVSMSRAYELFDYPKVRAESTALWQRPPRVAQPPVAFQWGMSSYFSTVGPHRHTPYSDWQAFYEELNPDIVRQFVAWRDLQPLSPEQFVRTSRSGEQLTAFANAGFPVQAAVLWGPRWAATGGILKNFGIGFWSDMPPIGYADSDGTYAQFLARLHAEYPNIRVMQVWNEPNWPAGDQSADLNPLVSRFWRGSAKQYGDLLASSISAVDGYGDAVQTALGGIADPRYAATVLEDPRTRDVGIWDIHFAAGQGNPDVGFTVDLMLALGRDHLEVLQSVGIENPHISISEISYPWTERGAEDQADFVARAYSTANALGWGTLFWWTLSPFEPGFGRDSGIINFDHTPRPAYYAYLFNKQTLGGASPDGLGGDGENVRIAKFKSASGKPIWVAWARSGSGSLTWPADAGNARVFDLDGTPIGSAQPGTKVPLEDRAHYIVSD